MQPMTSKELEYLIDSISNEELLIKQCAAAAEVTTTQPLKQFYASMVQKQKQHIDALVNAIKQHQQLAPAQIQS